MHNAWMRAVCGRMKSDYSYSPAVYNPFSWPLDVSVDHARAIEQAGRQLLAARAEHAGKSLAWLYGAQTMPGNVQNAHDAIDVAVDDAYGYLGSNDDPQRVAFLFERYVQSSSFLPPLTDDSVGVCEVLPVPVKRRRTT